MCFQKRDVKFKGHRGVLITTAALNKISKEREKRKRVRFYFTPKKFFVVMNFKVVSSDVLHIVMSVILHF